MSIRTRHNLLYLLVFGIAMGFLEAIVVVYLRAQYYPDGFSFPMAVISMDIYAAELVRELCTIVMLLAVAFICGQNRLQRLSYFFYSFAIWDIFYYVGLKAFLDWPPSLLTWDILFLIPVPWLGPLLAPLLCSLTMIVFSLIVLHVLDEQADFTFRIRDWVLLISGAVVVFITFIWDYTAILISNDLIFEFFSLSESQQFRYIITSYVPVYYNWPLFIFGMILIYIPIFAIFRRFLISSEVD
ncbi:MAG: hypothetical protein JXL67_12315 [Calditrichaeota bacterium]|nr:hypothetical protein [Calditrichota bacterium]